MARFRTAAVLFTAFILLFSASFAEDPLQEDMAIHSSILARRIPWTEEPGRLQSMGLQKVGHN